MADVWDRAAAYQNKSNVAAIDRHRMRPGYSDQILRFCADCGREIPAARRQAARKSQMACSRCITCQTRFEEQQG